MWGMGSAEGLMMGGVLIELSMFFFEREREMLSACDYGTSFFSVESTCRYKKSAYLTAVPMRLLPRHQPSTSQPQAPSPPAAPLLYTYANRPALRPSNRLPSYLPTYLIPVGHRTGTVAKKPSCLSRSLGRLL